MINYKENQMRNHITWYNKNTKCKHCKENLRASNVTRHEKVCIKGKIMRKRKEKQCIEKIKKQVRTEKCKKCKEIISKSNMRKHEETCGSKYIIRRNYLKKEN